MEKDSCERVVLFTLQIAFRRPEPMNTGYGVGKRFWVPTRHSCSLLLTKFALGGSYCDCFIQMTNFYDR
jgi:hypothetical protein